MHDFLMAEQRGQGGEQPNYGGHDYEFVGQVADRYNCQICTKIIREPHLAVCCGQHFCESCLNKWFARQGKESCPHCRAEGEGFHRVINKGLRSEINQLKIKCNNHGKGCKWTGELGTLKTHLNSDKGCGFVFVDCPNKCKSSGAAMLRKQLAEHLESWCPLRPYQCKFCGFKDNYLRITGTTVSIPDVLTVQGAVSHYDKCLMYPVDCPNLGCGMYDIQRKDMALHRSVCPWERVNCPFTDAGCEMSDLRRCELNDHLSANQQYHLLLVMGAYKHMKDKLQETEAKLTVTEARLTVTEAKLTTAVWLLRQGSKADKKMVDSITSCSTFLTKKGNSIAVVMPRVSEYHRTESGWFSPPFYYKLGYKMCLVVRVQKMMPGACSHIYVGIDLLEGEYDSRLEWPIGSYDHLCVVDLPPLQKEHDTMRTFFRLCSLTALQGTNQQLYCEKDTAFQVVNDCLKFHIICHGCYLEVKVGCVRNYSSK